MSPKQPTQKPKPKKAAQPLADLRYLRKQMAWTRGGAR